MHFNKCSDLLKSMMSVTSIWFDRQTLQKRTFEMPKDHNGRGEHTVTKLFIYSWGRFSGSRARYINL